MRLFLCIITISLLSSMSFAQSTSVSDEIKAMILNDQKVANETNENLNNYSKGGALEFWSSGGLLNSVTNEVLVNRFDNLSLQAKHIEVISIAGGQAAVAMYYNEGSMKPQNAGSVDHYLTRITQVFVKEEGEWVIVAAHFSPVTGGSGTSQTSTDN
ncbi:MAG: hypothetical protein DBW78_04565 [Rhodothermaeota bacterium MED-G64]|nr:MAG: hypothetical protein DBW78_04565 [Rhodothermaeota bacterium MED-G64]